MRGGGGGGGGGGTPLVRLGEVGVPNEWWGERGTVGQFGLREREREGFLDLYIFKYPTARSSARRVGLINSAEKTHGDAL